MWEVDHKEGWVPKNWCFWIVVLEKALESLLDCEEIKPINPKGNHPWIFIARIDAETEVPILWPPDVKSWLIGKDPDARKDWRQKERGWQRMRWLDSISDSIDMNLRKLQEMVEDWGAWHAAVHGAAQSQTWPNLATEQQMSLAWSLSCFLTFVLHFSYTRIAKLLQHFCKFPSCIVFCFVICIQLCKSYQLQHNTHTLH